MQIQMPPLGPVRDISHMGNTKSTRRSPRRGMQVEGHSDVHNEFAYREPACMRKTQPIKKSDERRIQVHSTRLPCKRLSMTKATRPLMSL